MLLLAVACTSSPPIAPHVPVWPTPGFEDADGDGLTNVEEAALGTDPSSPDSDGDGIGDQEELVLGTSPILEDSDRDRLSDLEELDLGTDPLRRDTDQDGYTDYQEVDAGTDPLDPESVIYTLGWPYNPDKERLHAPAWSQADFADGTRAGKPFPELIGLDAEGELVTSWDFLRRHRPVVVVLCPPSCPPCVNLAAYFRGDGDGFPFPSIRAAALEGQVSILFAISNFGEPLPAETCADWQGRVDPTTTMLCPQNPAEILEAVQPQYFPMTFALEPDGDSGPYSLTFNPYLALDLLEDELALGG